jgi:aspartate-semialdehyde dehydrogenase
LADTKSAALVGSDSLLGREIRDIVATSTTGIDLRLIAAEEEHAGALTRIGDEPAVVGGLDAESLDNARAIFLAASQETSRKALELAGDPPDAAIIDLTYTAEERPDARLRAPLIEAGMDIEEHREAAVHVIAHPAAIAIALFLRRLHTNDPVRRSIVHIFAPASEHGAPGVEELQQQTVSLLSFKSMPKAIFDAQASFAMLPKYGEEAPVALEESELRIERHLATLLDLTGDGEGAPMPSLRVIQAPVFHGYSFSAWVEFEGNPGVEALENGLQMESIDVRGAELDPPNNVGQAGQSGISVGAILPDRNDAEAVWFWFVADNLRLAAESAVAVARELL